MTWTAPRTWVTAELVTAAIGNTHWRDNFNAVQRVLDIDQTQTEVVSTVAATDVYSFSVAGGTLGTRNALRLMLVGDYLNNDGAGRALTMTVKFGGTTHIEQNYTSDASATRRIIKVVVWIGAGNATNVQRIFGEWIIGAATSPTAWAAAGTAQTTAGGVNTLGLAAAGAIDSTSAQTLALTVTHSASSANLSFRQHYTVLELLRLD